MVNFGEFLKKLKLAVKQCYQTAQVNFNRTKNGGKCQNSNATFWVQKVELEYLNKFL